MSIRKYKIRCVTLKNFVFTTSLALKLGPLSLAFRANASTRALLRKTSSLKANSLNVKLQFALLSRIWAAIRLLGPNALLSQRNKNVLAASNLASVVTK